MQFIADFHIHSKYSRATSKNMDLEHLAEWSKRKGVDLLGTGDFTHHLWLQELQSCLRPKEKTGLYQYQGVNFILSGEISSIYSQGGKTYRVHNLLLAPSFKVVKEINRMLSFYGNIASDGRPILGISCFRLAEELFRISDQIMLIPAHIWTPWFSVFGSRSGFDSLEEAFGKYRDNITALETGLSSDPAMNWMVSALDKFSLVSNSDSHSPNRVGREANVFDCELNYWQIKEALEKKDKSKFLYTIEFFPQEGKYHYDGHRNCKKSFHPKQTKEYNGICPLCKKPLTKGVLNRVNQLADREEGFVPEGAIGYKSLVPLDEIIAEAEGVGKNTKTVAKIYLDLVANIGPELELLDKLSPEELSLKLPDRLASGIRKVREKQVELIPGYDGEYGQVKVFQGKGNQGKDNQENQLTLF
ncbi:MAG: endonuclease Q family protein [Candidatus Omnitrophica bacterium]|nr:endonuclease Q family protein [Candidatus Omnitrophota bacterium]MCF7876883.1 endonuclease Q family protein [Candidatus Omnitrophota bacterium]MCF7877950.1 endonuclease Q family protein [Candidatus Omnitrophota bacterium]MCF7892697.1 endonuclease Q family protein [Candidatus Omnitrophota bacterium]